MKPNAVETSYPDFTQMTTLRLIYYSTPTYEVRVGEVGNGSFELAYASVNTHPLAICL